MKSAVRLGAIHNFGYHMIATYIRENNNNNINNNNLERTLQQEEQKNGRKRKVEYFVSKMADSIALEKQKTYSRDFVNFRKQAAGERCRQNTQDGISFTRR